VIVRLLSRRRDVRQARQLARLLLALDDANRERQGARLRRVPRTSMTAR
jgi:hypothetical protein